MMRYHTLCAFNFISIPMNILIVSDIFGVNESTHLIARSFDSLGHVSVFDPYDGKTMCFQNEQQAYQFFTSLGGVNTYADKLLSCLDNSESIDFAVGFSTGGAALWQVASMMTKPFIKRLICFYPNQVRHMTHLDPKCPTQVILPQKELHFCVQSLANSLANKALVEMEFVDQSHGFMNESSENYNRAARLYWLEKLKHIAQN